MTTRILLLSTLLLTATCAAAATTGYRYYGIRTQRGPVTLQLNQAHTPGGHVAVWFGANDQRGHWVQAGIAATPGTQPFLYLETTRYGKPSLQQWPIRMHQPIHVRVVSRGGRWQAQANTHHSPWVWLYQPTIDSMLETLGNATGKAQVNTQRITSDSP